MTADDAASRERGLSAFLERNGLALLAAAVFAAFALGADAGPHPFDAGELAAAAARLGGSHAPGQPLHALLGWTVHWLPLGSFVLRLSWLSAAGAALASYAAARTVLTWAGAAPHARVLAACAAIAIALTPAVVRNAMRPEVYTPALACVLLAAWALAARAQGERSGLRVAAILAGLAFALHPPHAIAIAGMALVHALAKRPSMRELGSAVLLGALTTAALIAYLPLRGAAGAPCWGDPTSAAGLWAYVSGAAYRRNLGTQGGDVIDVARYLLFFGGGLPVVAIALSARARALWPAWASALLAMVAALLQPLEERNPDNVAYDAPALALIVIAAAATLATRSESAPRWAWAGALVPLPALAASLAGGFLASADAPVLETLAFEAASAPSPRALVVTRTDFVAGAMMQSLEVDALRPDLAHFVEGLSTSSWHWRALARHPLFDGTPRRGRGAGAHEAYVDGVLALAAGQLEIDVESASTVAGEGTLRGLYLVRPPLGAGRGLDERSTAERTMGAIASTLARGPAGDHDAHGQIVRFVVLSRAPLLVARGRGARARSELRWAAPGADEGRAVIADGPLAASPADVVHDPRWFLAAPGDGLRAVAVLAAASGHPAEATRALGAQQAAGDDLALAQLAALQLHDGLLAPARTSFAAFRAREPELRSPALDALAAALAP
ncbi:MAG: DUF2723 domain-containing protein [Sandaracinus sp.]